MGTTLRQQLVTMLLVTSDLAASGVFWSPRQLLVQKETPVQDICPPCELFFTKLEDTGGNGKLSQFVAVQERGEPKSGTGFMYFWAIATFIKTCDYLKGLYGEGSCTVEFNAGVQENGEILGRTYNRSMIFEPALGGDDSRCSCETIDSKYFHNREVVGSSFPTKWFHSALTHIAPVNGLPLRVAIVLTKNKKHTLPVEASCAYSHNGGMDLAISDRYIGKTACTFEDGSKVENKDDLWRCMQEANCEINDDWLQMAVFRDPRPMVVSSYFHRKVQGSKHLGELNDFVTRELPILCQWVALRYMLFRGLLVHQSMEFWYDDVMSDPLRFHYHWFYSVGLQLPPQVVKGTTQAAVADKLGFGHKDIDAHPGEKPRNDSGVRRFEDEVSPELVEMANTVLRAWLPAVLLDRLGIVP